VTQPRRPAAYGRVDSGSDAVSRAARQGTIADLARRNGWPEPMIYLDQDQPEHCADAAALVELAAAVTAGRHSAVLLVGTGAIHGCPAHLLQGLLRDCSRQGITVDFLLSAGS
jgi:hypothetical protein